LEILDNNGNMNSAYNTITENIKLLAKESIGQCESKHHKPWCDEDCLKLVDRRKQAKLQWLENSGEVNEYLKDKINEHDTNGQNKDIRDQYRGKTEFKKGYQPRTKFVKDRRGYLLVDPHKILNRWKNYFFQVLKVHGVGGVRQIYSIQQSFVLKSSASDIESAIGKLKRHKLPGVDHIPAELNQAREDHSEAEAHQNNI
jgi:ABC-type antimicrobial peptide transport system permease subunit